MRYLILFLMIFSLAASGQRTYYMATNGNDANAGTITAPFRSLQKGWSVISAGDTLYVRGGTYTISSQQVLNGKSGTASAKINLFAYPDEKPVISRVNGSFTKSYWHRGMVFLSGNYIHVKGIRFTGTYTYYLTVTDDKGATGTDTMKVTVNPAPRTVLLNIWVYSDKRVSTATRQNMNKTLICRIRVYNDGSIERIN